MEIFYFFISYYLFTIIFFLLTRLLIFQVAAISGNVNQQQFHSNRFGYFTDRNEGWMGCLYFIIAMVPFSLRQGQGIKT